MVASENAVNTEDVLEGVFHFDPGDGIYREHFPGYPVVPGSLIVHAFLTAVREAEIKGDVLSIENVRFREFLKPGRYPFRMEFGENRILCSISRGDKKLVTGVMKI
ncbi:MAG: hypothetical protein PHY29_00660 [Syntrophales bacterium]|nr:hypothetical protein [Syntrophales bacterium]